MNSRNKHLDELLEIIEESKGLLATSNDLSERLEYLRNHTSIKEIVSFNSHHNYFFESIIDNLEHLVRLKSQVEDLKEVPDTSNENYEVGDVLTASVDIRFSREGKKAKKLDTNGNMYDRIFSETDIVIMDFIGSTYTIFSLSHSHYGLIYATKTQLQMLFKHTNKKHDVGYHKVSFNINGIGEEYFEKLDDIYLYEKTPLYDMNEFYMYKLQAVKSQFFDFTYDEAFGTMVVAYFMGDLKTNYPEISFFFASKFAVMFSQDGEDKDMYKYNSKKSKFSKESGKDGKHYFPKDVFNTKGTKGRVLNVLEITNMFEGLKEEAI